MKAAQYQGPRTMSVGASAPSAPGLGQVRIRVSHVGICGTDYHIYLGDLDARVKRPLTIGHEMSGVIEEIGPQTRGYSPGDRVTAIPLLTCGKCSTCTSGYSQVCPSLCVLGVDAEGAMQTWWNAPAANLLHLPSSLSLEHGALIEPLAVACHDVAMAQLQPNEKVLVIGGGPIGALIALVAHHAGAEVIVSEINPRRVELLRGVGLEVINPRETPPAQFCEDWTEGRGVDAVFEVSGAAAGAELMTDVLRPRGRIVLVSIFASRPPVNLHRFFARELVLMGARLYQKNDFEEAIRLAAAGTLPLEGLISDRLEIDGIAEAFRRIETGESAMKILIRCAG